MMPITIKRNGQHMMFLVIYGILVQRQCKNGIKHGFVLAEHYPMHFDGFYVSILSEKNQKHF